MSDGGGQTTLVKSLYNFKGANNDELNFSKGDVITVTQMVEGGWWEGTFKGCTGWFPSNYVKEHKQDTRAGAKSPVGKPCELSMNKRESMLFYHNVVIQSLIDTERTFVSDLASFLQTYLRPLHSANILSPTEVTALCGNLEKLLDCHHTLLARLDECAKLVVLQQRVGDIFMKQAPPIQTEYMDYCANHPSAVLILQTHKEDLTRYMEGHGAPSPGIMTLTTALSKPFTRLDKYPSLLKELERHSEESHPDRGDTQRAISVYRDIIVACTDRRKQKELELEIMNGTVTGWEGESDLSSLGEVLLLTHVRVHVENGEKKDFVFMLFPGLVIILSASSRMSHYMFEGKLPVSGMNVEPLDDDDTAAFAFKITGSMIDSRVVSCGSSAEKKLWIDLLRTQSKLGPAHMSAKPQSLQISTSQPSVSTLSQAKNALMVVPHTRSAPPRTPPWSMSCLRPCPPLRPATIGHSDPNRSPRTGRRTLAGKRKVDDTKTIQEDAEILRVIEAYCTSAKTRHTVNSSLLDSPQVLIAEEEKIIIEETKGGQTFVEEKSLVDTVYSLKDTVSHLKQEQMRMRKDLEDEKRARKRLESMLRKSLRSLVETAYNDPENSQVT